MQEARVGMCCPPLSLVAAPQVAMRMGSGPSLYTATPSGHPIWNTGYGQQLVSSAIGMPKPPKNILRTIWVVRYCGLSTSCPRQKLLKACRTWRKMKRWGRGPAGHGHNTKNSGHHTEVGLHNTKGVEGQNNCNQGYQCTSGRDTT